MDSHLSLVHPPGPQGHCGLAAPPGLLATPPSTGAPARPGPSCLLPSSWSWFRLHWQPPTSCLPASKAGPSTHPRLECSSTHGPHVHSSHGPAGPGPRRPELWAQPLKPADLALGRLPAFPQATSLARCPGPSILIRQKQAGRGKLGWAGQGRAGEQPLTIPHLQRHPRCQASCSFSGPT